MGLQASRFTSTLAHQQPSAFSSCGGGWTVAGEARFFLKTYSMIKTSTLVAEILQIFKKRYQCITPDFSQAWHGNNLKE